MTEITDSDVSSLLDNVNKVQKEVDDERNEKELKNKDKIEKQDKKLSKRQQKWLESAFKRDDTEHAIALKKQLESYRESDIISKRLKESGYKLERIAKLKNVDELEDEIELIEKLLKKRTRGDMVNGMVRGAMMTTELLLINKAQLKVKGLTDQCFSDEDWLFTLERVKCKYGLMSLGFEVDPLLELTMSTFYAGLLLHRTHESMSKIPDSKRNLDQVIDVKQPSSKMEMQSKDKKINLDVLEGNVTKPETKSLTPSQQTKITTPKELTQIEVLRLLGNKELSPILPEEDSKTKEDGLCVEHPVMSKPDQVTPKPAIDNGFNLNLDLLGAVNK